MWKRAFRAFKYRNYRWFFSGQLVSMMGSWMQQVAIAWIVYDLTGSALLLATMTTLTLLPGLFIGPLAGVAADRMERRKILRFANIGFVIQASTVLCLFLLGALNVPVLILMAFGLGLAQGIDWPVRQSLVMDLVDDPADLSSAIALNSIVWNLARLVGPMLGGLLLSFNAISACFALNALGSLWAWFTIGQIRTPKRDHKPSRHPFADLLEGIRFAASDPTVRTLILIPVAAGMLFLPYTAMLPIVASEWLNGGPSLYGFLSATPAIGAIGGGLFLASRPDARSLPKIVHFSGLLCGLALMAFTLSRNIPLTLALLGVLGLCFILQLSSVNTLLQLAVSDAFRGRVLALYTALFTGCFPLGLMLTGALADAFGSDSVLFVCGAFGTVILFFLSRNLMHLALNAPSRDA